MYASISIILKFLSGSGVSFSACHFSNSYHALQYWPAVHQQMEAILVVLVHIVNLRVHQIQSRFMHGEFAIVSKREVPIHAKIDDPIARLPCPEDAIVVSRPAVASVLIPRREEGAVRPVMDRVNLP